MTMNQYDSNNKSTRGKLSYIYGHRFEKKVAELLKLKGYTIDLNIEDDDSEIDIFCKRSPNILLNKEIKSRIFVECKYGKNKVDKMDIKKFIINVKHARMNDKCDRGLMVSNLGFTQTSYDLRNSINFIDFKTYDEFLAEAIDFSDYLKKLIDDVEKPPENSPNEPPLKDYYIDLQTDIDFNSYFKNWIQSVNPLESHPVILGSYGTGKTTFCKMLARNLAKEYIESYDRTGLRIPILFNLKEYITKTDIESLITYYLDKICGINARYELFNRMNKAGQFILIFDGFDEMASKVSFSVIQKIFLKSLNLLPLKKAK